MLYFHMTVIAGEDVSHWTFPFSSKFGRGHSFQMTCQDVKQAFYFRFFIYLNIFFLLFQCGTLIGGV